MKRYIASIIVVVLLLASCKPEVVEPKESKENTVFEVKEETKEKNPLCGLWMSMYESIIIREDGTVTYMVDSGSGTYVGSWEEKDGKLTIQYKKASSMIKLANNSEYTIESHVLKWRDPYSAQYHTLYSIE